MTLREALDSGYCSLEDELDFDDTPQGEEIACLRLENERLQNKVEELMELYTTERHCKDDYKSIIKEVREKINNYTTRMEVLNYQISDLTKKELLEILDKGSDK